MAVDKYPVGNGWAEIHATNDVALIKPLLLGRNFKPQNIAVLLNEQATKRAIISALKRLVAQSRRGDNIYIHFSCHGQQMADDNADEPDGLDEALIPYDAPRRFSRGVYEGQNHLRDDELGLWLDALRIKIGAGGDVVLTLDACHSGTGDRDDDPQSYVRGTSYVFAPPEFVPQRNGKAIDEIRSSPKMAPLMVIAACMPDELNYEYRSPGTGRYYGSLTYALSLAIQNSVPLNCQTLHTKLRKEIAELNPRRIAQKPLLQTSDEKKEFRIGIR